MIVGFLLTIFYGFLEILISILPLGGTFPSGWVVYLNTLWGYVNSFSFLVPVDTFVICLGIAIGFHLFVFSWHAIHWVYSLIRGYHY